LARRELTDPPVGLAQLHPKILGQAHQPLARPVQQLGVGREHHRLWLNRGVDNDAGQIGRLHRLGAAGHRQALLQQCNELLFPHALAPARQRGAVEHQPVLEELLAAEVLIIPVLNPVLAQRLVGEVLHVLEDGKPRH
jgi:hypothetical protein